MAAKLALELVDVETATGVFADHDHVRHRLAPRQLVGMVLVGADEHDRPLAAAEPEHPDQRVDRGRRARTAEQHDVLVGAAHRAVDDAAGVFPQRRGVQARGGRLGVRVRVQRQHALADVVLDERQCAARGRVVGIHQPPRTERPIQDGIVTDHGTADPIDEMLGLRAPSGCAPPHLGVLVDLE